MTTPPPLGALEMTVEAGDGLLLKGALVYPELPSAAQYPLAVLAHQYPATADSFAPLIEDLLDLGVATLAFDQRGHGASTVGRGGPLVIDSPLGFTADAFGAAFVSSAGKVGFNRIDDDVIRVASWGACQSFVDSSRIMLVGASVGGTGVTLAAPRVPELRALLTFGAAGELVWGPDGRQKGRKAMERLSAPALHTSAQDDPFSAALNAQAWSEGLPKAKTKIVPGTGHAMAIYYEVRGAVRDFVKRSLF
ncbi:MAG TPA: alpha/beta fold hydrolase [Gemmatimonadales bacterium]|nr:alpha/beta fold hydrolase [Gemmatimonadales bacterium]